MKILYLLDPEPDYGSTQLYMGLCQLLGDENIVDFPYKCGLHGKAEHCQSVEIANFVIDNPTLYLAGVGAIPYSWITPSKGIECHYDEIVNMIKSGVFNLILLSPRAVAIYYLKRLINDCKCGIPYDMPPVILCDFNDGYDVRINIMDMFYPHIKMMTMSSYHPINLVRKSKKYVLHPLMYSSAIADNLIYHIGNIDDSNENKTIDVNTRISFTNPLRKVVVESLRKMGEYHHKNVLAILITGIAPNTYCSTYEQYLEEIAKSKIAIVMRGHGGLGLPNRTWEVTSYNTLMLFETPNCHYEHPFEDGKNCVFFNPEIKDDVCQKALYWLSDEMENERRKIARAGNEHLKKYHTCKARAIELLDMAHTEGLI